LPPPRLEAAEVKRLYEETATPLDAASNAESDAILRELQAIMFAYGVGILKRADRLEQASRQVESLAEKFDDLSAPHTHELVRLKETQAMLAAARLILGASLYRMESRLSHFREDHVARDDASWLVWVDISAAGGVPQFAKMPVPTPLCAVTPTRRPTRLRGQIETPAACRFLSPPSPLSGRKHVAEQRAQPDCIV
jgi:succinate dehydrogenase/fumarate reductase flavoprotein subunit